MRITKKLYIAAASLVVAVGALVALNVTGTASEALSTVGSRSDCTRDAIVYCGVTSTEQLANKYSTGDIGAVFGHYNISKSDIQGTTAQVKLGTIRTDGKVYVGNEVVATGARSVYRYPEYSNPVKTFTVNGNTFYEYNVAGHYYKDAEVFVLYKDNKFFAAIQASCGNPIVATPVTPPTPPAPKQAVVCDSLTAIKKDAHTYTFTAKATATNGAKVVSYTYNFGDNTSATTTKTTLDHYYKNPGTYTARVTVNAVLDGKNVQVTNEKCTYKVTIPETPKPAQAVVCESLTAIKKDRDTYTFTTKATATNGAKIVNYTYNFGDNTSATTGSTVSHDYKNVGTFTAKVTVNAVVDGKNVSVTGANCTYKVTIPEEVKPAVVRCDDLKAQLISGKDRTYSYTLRYTNTNATLDRAVFNFGDNTSATYTRSQLGSIVHEYKNPGTYTTTATLYFIVMENGKLVTKNDECTYKITVPKPQDNCPIPGKTHLPVDSPECKEVPVENCPMPGKEHLPKDSKECVETPVVTETPPELPKTGLETFIGGGMGLGSIIAAGSYWSASRRNLLNTLLKK